MKRVDLTQTKDLKSHKGGYDCGEKNEEWLMNDKVTTDLDFYMVKKTSNIMFGGPLNVTFEVL